MRLLGGSVSVCKMCGKLGGACSPGEVLILELLLDAIWWNLGLFSGKHNLQFIVIKTRILRGKPKPMHVFPWACA